MKIPSPSPSRWLPRWVRVAVAFGAAAAVAGLLVLAAAGSAQATTTAITSTATIKNSPDDGCAPWARDTFTRTTVIDVKGEGTYTVAIKDEGTFATAVGAKTPGDATKTIGAAVTGTLDGSGAFTVTGTLLDTDALAALNGKVYDNGSYDCKQDVPEAKTTGKWPLKYFAPGATTTGIDPWKWIYTTACETRTESSTAEPVGNITGKVCPSPSTSVSASPAPSLTGSASGVPIVGQPTLPVTGSKVQLVAGLGALLVAIGATGVIVGRRRRRDVFIAE